MSEAALGPRRPRASGAAFARAYVQAAYGNNLRLLSPFH
jgi:hypothetical protein